MYCRQCGKPLEEQALFCAHCGESVSPQAVPPVTVAPPAKEDKGSVGIGILCFFFPLLALILHFAYEDKNPKRAKAAAIGGVSFVSVVVLIIMLIAGMACFTDIDAAEDAEVTIGEFVVIADDTDTRTYLEVTVKNISDERQGFWVTVEALNPDGSRLGLYMVYAEYLGVGQSTTLKAFEDLYSEDIDKYQAATYEVLEIEYGW